MTGRINKLTEILNRFDTVQDADLQDDIDNARRRLSSVNPEMTLTAESELASIGRQIINIAKDAIYAQMNVDAAYAKAQESGTDEAWGEYEAIADAADAAGVIIERELG